MTANSGLVQVEQEDGKNVGGFSHYKCQNGQSSSPIHITKLTTEGFPATQVLNQIGCYVTKDSRPGLNTKTKPINKIPMPDITIQGFDKQSTLVITGERLKQQIDSGKVYVNTQMFPKGKYEKYINGKENKQTDDAVKFKRRKRKAGTDEDIEYDEHYADISTSVCIAQQVDFLVAYKNDSQERAIIIPRQGIIQKDHPSVLLLSTPALIGQNITARLRTTYPEYIENMFRVIFYAALQGGCNYITLPAAGLGVYADHMTDLTLSRSSLATAYFDALFKVAEEFPGLNIIYNPANFSSQFQAVATNHPEVFNVLATKKDVMFLAHELSLKGHRVAYHNPSDPAVVMKSYGVGMFWYKAEKRGQNFVGEEVIGACTTGITADGALDDELFTRIHESRCQIKDLMKHSDEKRVFNELIKSISQAPNGLNIRTECLQKALYEARLTSNKWFLVMIEKYCLYAANLKDDPNDYFSLHMMMSIEAIFRGRQFTAWQTPINKAQAMEHDQLMVQKTQDIKLNNAVEFTPEAKTLITNIRTQLENLINTTKLHGSNPADNKYNLKARAFLNEILYYLEDGIKSSKWKTTGCRWLWRSLSGLYRLEDFLKKMQMKTNFTDDNINQFLNRGKTIKNHLQGTLFLARKRVKNTETNLNKEILLFPVQRAHKHH